MFSWDSGEVVAWFHHEHDEQGKRLPARSINQPMFEEVAENLQHLLRPTYPHDNPLARPKPQAN